MKKAITLSIVFVVILFSTAFSQHKPVPSKGFTVMANDGKFKSFEFNRHAVGDNDILIETMYASICHSDVHHVHGDWGTEEYPMVPGHEIAGKVTQVGKNVTNWHTHKSGQILFVMEGIGYYQEKGKLIQLIQKGDVVKIPKNVKHWHGASPKSSMRHIAMITDYDKDITEWLEPVADADYNSFSAPAYEVENNLSVKAIMNQEQLWPNYVSQAKETDPDLIEVFNNFAFDEVISHDKMDAKTRTLLIMASTIGSQALTEYKMFVNGALNIGVSPMEIKEVLYQSVPYVGISKVLDFIYATNEIFTARNIALPLESQSTTNSDTRMEKGLAKQKEIVGDRVDEMYKNSPKDLLHIQQYLSSNCFGDYITRDGLDIKMREMVTLSFLIAMGGTESQIKGHIQGNANVGNDRQTLINLMTQLIPYVGYPRTLNAINCLNEILAVK